MYGFFGHLLSRRRGPAAAVSTVTLPTATAPSKKEVPMPRQTLQSLFGREPRAEDQLEVPADVNLIAHDGRPVASSRAGSGRKRVTLGALFGAAPRGLDEIEAPPGVRPVACSAAGTKPAPKPAAKPDPAPKPAPAAASSPTYLAPAPPPPKPAPATASAPAVTAPSDPDRPMTEQQYRDLLATSPHSRPILADEAKYLACLLDARARGSVEPDPDRAVLAPGEERPMNEREFKALLRNTRSTIPVAADPVRYAAALAAARARGSVV